MIDTRKIRVGDEVYIRAIVDDINEDGFPRMPFYLKFEAKFGTTAARFCGDQIVSHTPKALEVGEVVTVIRRFHDSIEEEPWTLLFIDDSSFALVGRGNHTRAVKSLRDLERAS